MNIQGKYIVACLLNAVAYIPTTLYIAVLVLLIGFIFGTLIAVVRTRRIPVLAQLFDLYVVIFKAVPVNLMIVAAGLLFTANFNTIAAALHLSIRVRDVNLLYVGVFALSFNSTTMMSEHIRGALLSVGKGQYEAGSTVGLTYFQTFRRIIFPQLMLVLLPALTGTVIAIIKASSLVILLGVVDILNGALKYANESYCFFEAYLAAAIVYWAFSLVIQYGGKALEKQLGKHRRLLA